MTTPASAAFGVDIGGTGIKAAPVDLTTGQLTAERTRIPTPQPATPDAVAAVVAGITRTAGWHGPLGVTLPSVVDAGVARTAANIDPSWIGTDAGALLTAATGCPVTVLNDADAAGVAEMRYGVGRGRSGLVLMLTFGTGIGSALFSDGVLVPNTELGHLEVDGADAERAASAVAREREDLSWKKWSHRVSRYLLAVEKVLWPQLIIVGGGASKSADRWVPLLTNRTPVVAAQLHNDAGIVGAALAGAVKAPVPAGSAAGHAE